MLEDKPLNVRCAEALGWKAWTEKRGNYTLCVTQAPGDHEPWKGTRLEFQRPGDYKPVTLYEAEEIGWYARGLPPYGEDSPEGWACTGPLLDRIARMADRVVITQSVGVDGEFTHLDAVGPFLSAMVQGGVSHVIAEWVAQHGEALKNG